MSAPLVINNMEFARKALELHDRIAVSHFSRVRDLLDTTEGEIEWRLSGYVNASGRPMLNLQIQGDVQLRCQRCLEPFRYTLDTQTAYLLVADEAAIPLASDEEALAEEEYLAADMQMHVLDLIEDEILLALPYAAKHDEAQCGAGDTLDELKKPNPFAVLQGLKSGKSQNS